MTTDSNVPRGLTHRTALRAGAVGAAGVAAGALGGLAGPSLARRGLLSADGVLTATGTAVADTLFYKEVYPTGPLILEPFKDELVVPRALRPAPDVDTWSSRPGPGDGQQNGSDGRYGTGPDSLGNERHQVWPSSLGLPDPIVYKIEVKVAQHSFTTSKVSCCSHEVPSSEPGRPPEPSAVRSGPRGARRAERPCSAPATGSAHSLRAGVIGGAEGIRTPDLLIANETRYQLRHSPERPSGGAVEREEEVTTDGRPRPNRVNGEDRTHQVPEILPDPAARRRDGAARRRARAARPRQGVPSAPRSRRRRRGGRARGGSRRG